MKNAVRIIAIMMVVGLTSCGMHVNLPQQTAPSILPNDFGENVNQNIESQETTNVVFENTQG